MSLGQSHLRLLRVAALVVWAMVGVPLVVRGVATNPVAMLGWAMAYVAFGGALGLTLRGADGPRRGVLWLIGLQALAVIVMVRLLCQGWEGSLLVLVAAELGIFLQRRAGLVWIVSQTLLFAWAIASHWSTGSALLLTPPYFGLQILALLALELLAGESSARLALVRANAELLAVHQILSESSRLGERVRISQDLHDALGHHLTALSLNLEVATHQTHGPALESVKSAQSLAKQLLGDVRDIVRSIKTPGAIALRPVLETLAEAVPRPLIHLDVPATLAIADPARAHVLVRCAQEIITNAIRHSQAKNLWIEVALEGACIRVRARDDGRGAQAINPGMGLAGMRDRLGKFGGTLELETSPGIGLRVTACIPQVGVQL
jgi:signal transduction histidine kinase